MGSDSKKEGAWWKEWLRSLLYAALFLLLFRNFFFTLYMVRSNSMESTLESGDWMAVNLLAYGPRIPSTPVCVPFTSWYVKWAETPVWRIPGYRTPQPNDVIVFNYPQDKTEAIERREVYVKRLIARPGDSVEIVSNNVIVNKKKFRESPRISKEYMVKTNKPIALRNWIKKQKSVTWRNLTRNEWLLNLTHAQQKKLSKQDFVMALEAPAYQDDEMLETLFTGKLKGYNILNFGRTKVPCRGMKITLNAINAQLYAHAIINEGNELQYTDSSCFINGKKQKEYVFEEDHYFVLGDSRSASVDSRHWGFVPRSHVVGRASFVLIAFGNKRNNSAIRWSQCLRSIQ